jgi:fumarylacetoacetase
LNPISGFGSFSVRGSAERRLGWRLGDSILDLGEGGLDPLLAQGRPVWERAVDDAGRAAERGSGVLHPLSNVELHLPFAVADYVDFYASLEHATNMGRILRPDGEPLASNWRALPVGYHGRSGTVVVSGTDISRPWGQTPEFGPTSKLDVELELGFVVGVGTDRGTRVGIDRFAEHVFGVLLLNDWSARDIQAFESRPLGPFLGKSFATSISAWVTPLALLEPAKVLAREQDPQPATYLRGDSFALDLELELELNGTVISRGNARTLYWTFPQMLAHATVNGASLRTGDIFGSGTVSGAERGSEGSLVELSRDGAEPVALADGRRRSFLDDGDEVVLRGGHGEIELGEVRGRVIA